MNEKFSEREKKIIEPFFTNLNKPVFVLKNLPQVVCGTLFSRYSRSSKPLRRLLLEDFIQREDVEFDKLVAGSTDTKKQFIAIKKAEEFYDRVLVDYGDDSVAELGGAHLAIEQASQLAAKTIEDNRIGLSPLEKSTRYIYFDQKINNEYQYYKGKELTSSRFGELYLETCNFLFETYSKLLKPMTKFFKENFPQQEEVSDRAYNSTIKAKTCDSLRGLLPASTLTNIGVYGNGRALEYLCTKMFADPLPENKQIAKNAYNELIKVIPSFVKRAKNAYGKQNTEFLRKLRTQTKKQARKIPQQKQEKEEYNTKLVWFDPLGTEKVIAASLYSETSNSMQQLLSQTKKMSKTQKKQIISGLLRHRNNRRHKPGRGFEAAYYCFEITANFGAYRDIQRHRMLTQQRKRITTRIGYDTPQEIIKAGFEKEFREAMEQADNAFKKIERQAPLLAQYVVPMAYRIKWYLTMNAREAYHLTELRSIAAGHPEYRVIAQDIYLQAKKVHPTLFEHAKFVDMNKYELERLESEKQQDKKIKEIEKKYGKKALN